ncbi:MAG: hypothetical protein ABH859_05685 [Pseudomonadota bacterium]
MNSIILARVSTREQEEGHSIDAQIARLKETVLLEQHTQADESFNTTVSTLLDLASRAYELFESSRPEQKRELINLTLSNLQLKGRTLEYQTRKPFSEFRKMASCTELLRRPDYHTSCGAPYDLCFAPHFLFCNSPNG